MMSSSKGNVIVGFGFILFGAIATVSYLVGSTGNISTAPQPSPVHQAPKRLAEVSDIELKGDDLTRPVSGSGVEAVPHPFCPHRQARTFPDVSYPVSVPRPWNKLEDITSANFSAFTIANPRSVYRVCDEIELRIEARNGRNEPKGFGGDYFRVKTQTLNKTFSAGSTSDGEVWDHGNGTYSAFITLKWTGHLAIQVLLIHPSEAVYLLEQYGHTRPARFNYTGMYVSSEDQDITEEVECNYLPFHDMDNTCNLTRRETTWYCRKPSKTSLSCEDWAFHKRSLKLMEDGEYLSISSTEKIAFSTTAQQISSSPYAIDVHEQRTGDIRKAISNLPRCTLRSHLKRPRVAGFYLNNSWISPYCRVLDFGSTSSIRECMSGTHWKYNGDSTIRQLFYYVMQQLELNITSDVSERTFWKPVNGSDTKYNINTYFEGHDLPLNPPSDGWLNVSLIQPVSTYLERIPSDISVVITVSIWAHYAHVPLTFYRQRIQVVIDAAERLYARNPRSAVILKSGNTRQHENMLRYLTCSDWDSRRMSEEIRSMLEKHPNVGYIDTWDTTYSQIARDFIHPLDPHTEIFNRMLLSMI